MSGEHSLAIDASLENLHEVRDFLATSGGKLNIAPETVADLQLAVDEAVTNIIVHGYGNRPGSIKVSMDRDADANVVVRLRDDAPLYDPTKNARPDLHVSPLARKVAGGYGVELVRQMVDELRYQAIDQHNELTLIKKA